MRGRLLWAITPEGRATNLGELQIEGNDAKVKVTTELQAFGLIVTAEPYFAVTQPSDVVVMENVVLARTEGSVETIQAKYELLKRGTYLMNQDAARLNIPDWMWQRWAAAYGETTALQIAEAPCLALVCEIRCHEPVPVLICCVLARSRRLHASEPPAASIAAFAPLLTAMPVSVTARSIEPDKMTLADFAD